MGKFGAKIKASYCTERGDWGIIIALFCLFLACVLLGMEMNGNILHFFPLRGPCIQISDSLMNTFLTYPSCLVLERFLSLREVYADRDGICS